MATPDEQFNRDFARLSKADQDAIRNAVNHLAGGRRDLSGSARNILTRILKAAHLSVPSWLARFGNATPPAGSPLAPSGRGGSRLPPPPPAAPAGAGDAEPDPPRRFTTGSGRSAPTEAPPRPGEEDARPKVTLCPQSSNVHSFWYQPGSRVHGTLYVCYYAPKINPAAVKVGIKSSSGIVYDKTHLQGKLGRTLIGKTTNPGATYAYFEVPAIVYRGMLSAVSKGKFVWDRLRVRGTIHGHQYAYRLVSGAIAPYTGAPGGIYIPRRATREGFRTRAVTSPGATRQLKTFIKSPTETITRRRASVDISTLPERKFTTGRGRRTARHKER